MYPGQTAAGKISRTRRNRRKAPHAHVVFEEDPEVQFVSFRSAQQVAEVKAKKIKNELPTPGWRRLPESTFKDVGEDEAARDEDDFIRDRRFIPINEIASREERTYDPRVHAPKKWLPISYPTPLVAYEAVKKATERCKKNGHDLKDDLGSFISDELKEAGFKDAAKALKLKPGYIIAGNPDN